MECYGSGASSSHMLPHMDRSALENNYVTHINPLVFHAALKKRICFLCRVSHMIIAVFFFSIARIGPAYRKKKAASCNSQQRRHMHRRESPSRKKPKPTKTILTWRHSHCIGTPCHEDLNNHVQLGTPWRHRCRHPLDSHHEARPGGSSRPLLGVSK